jgi:hypothetical protein
MTSTSKPFEYNAPKVWVRSFIFFALCWGVSIASGTFGRIVDNPLATSDQLSNPAWWIWTCAAFATVLVCYPIVWSGWTLTFDRTRHIGGQLLFGIAWGTSTGQLLASFYVLADRTGAPKWGVWVLAYIAASIWQGLFHDLYWDIYVTPEHDTPETVKKKVMFSHVPNVTVTLTYLVLYDNVAIFVGLQTIALTTATIAMRLPVFWDKAPQRPATTTPGLFGLPRASGYITDDPHPYRTEREVRRKQREQRQSAA